MARTILVMGRMYELIMTAEEFPGVEPEWRYTTLDTGSAMIRGDRHSVISWIAELINKGKVSYVQMHGPGIVRLDDCEIRPDGAGYVWRDDEYLAPNQYLPLFITERKGDTDE